MFDDIMTDSQRKKILASLIILVDTREKKGKNDHILKYFDGKGIPWRRQKLDYGDYSFAIPANEDLGITEEISFADKIMVERKANLEELSNNYTKDRERINKEFKNGPKNKILIIENATYADMVKGNYKTNYSPKSYWATVFTMWHRYNIPTIFLENNIYTGQYIYGYLKYYLYTQIRLCTKEK